MVRLYPNTSVSHSISYLQDYLSTAEDDATAERAAPSGKRDQPSHPRSRADDTTEVSLKSAGYPATAASPPVMQDSFHRDAMGDHRSSGDFSPSLAMTSSSVLRRSIGGTGAAAAATAAAVGSSPFTISNAYSSFDASGVRWESGKTLSSPALRGGRSFTKADPSHHRASTSPSLRYGNQHRASLSLSPSSSVAAHWYSPSPVWSTGDGGVTPSPRWSSSNPRSHSMQWGGPASPWHKGVGGASWLEASGVDLKPGRAAGGKNSPPISHLPSSAPTTSLSWGWQDEATHRGSGAGMSVAMAKSAKDGVALQRAKGPSRMPPLLPSSGLAPPQQHRWDFPQAAYEEVHASKDAGTYGAALAGHHEAFRVENSRSDEQLRQPPPPPPPPPAGAEAVTPMVGKGLPYFTLCSSQHPGNMLAIACYLKDYYAREAAETSRGVETLSPEDIAGLGQCFCVDLHRIVQRARLSLGMDVSAFRDGSASESTALPLTAPCPPQKEDRAQHYGGLGYAETAAARSPAPTAASSRSPPRVPPSPDHSAEASAAPTSPQQQHQSILSTDDTPTQPMEPADTAEWSGVKASMRPSQLAYSGTASHPVQMITALVPKFHNSDALSRSPNSNSVIPAPPQSFRPSISTASSMGTLHDRRATIAASSAAGGTVFAESEADRSLRALAASPCPPYKSPLRMQPLSHQSTDTSFTASVSFSAPHPPPLRRATPTTAATAPRTLRRQSGLTGPRSTHSSPQPPREDHQSTTAARSRRGETAESYSNPETFRPDLCPSSETGGSVSRFCPLDTREARASRPRTSSIAKRPLKELMPILRGAATLLVKYVGASRRPHLRLFQILDCTAEYDGQRVLMPHLTWVTPEHRESGTADARPGNAAHTGLSAQNVAVPYDVALNLVELKAVYVGVGRGIDESDLQLFLTKKTGPLREDVAVLDQTKTPVPPDMCAVLVFTTRSVAISFVREADRQVWLGAMMAVVERNKFLKV